MTPNQTPHSIPSERITALVVELFAKGMIKFGASNDFVLKSGMHSPVYIDLRSAISFPVIFRDICDCYKLLLSSLQSIHSFAYDSNKANSANTVLCGVPYSAITFASVVAYDMAMPMVLSRKEVKQYGTKKMVEGEIPADGRCILFEDVITTASSVLETIDYLSKVNLPVTDVCVIIDRNQGGYQKLVNLGYRVHCMTNLSQVVHILAMKGLISQKQLLTVNEYLSAAK